MMCNLIFLLLLLLPRIGVAQSYFSDSEFFHQTNEREHQFSYSYDFDKGHFRLNNFNGSARRTAYANRQLLDYEYGLSQNYSLGFNVTHIYSKLSQKFQFLNDEKFYEDGVESLGLRWRYRKRWRRSSLHLKLAVDLPPGSSETEVNFSAQRERSNANLDSRRTNLLLGYRAQIFYEHYWGFALEKTLFQTKEREKAIDQNNITVGMNIMSGAEKTQLTVLYEIPEYDQLFGFELYYLEVTDVEREDLGAGRSKLPGEKSYNLAAYYRRPLLNMEFVVRANYGYHVQSGDLGSMPQFERISYGTLYGAQGTFRIFF